MPLPWKKQLADAHHRNRALDNRIHELERQLASREATLSQVMLERNDFEQKVMDLAEKLAMVQADAAGKKKYRPLTDTELYAVASVVTLEALPGSPNSLRVLDCLIDELAYRGVLPPKEP